MRYRGVSWNRSSKKWVASIEAGEGAIEFLGLFESQLDAARKYDAHAGRIGLPTNFTQQHESYAEGTRNRPSRRISHENLRLLYDSGVNEMQAKNAADLCGKESSACKAHCQQLLTHHEQTKQSQLSYRDELQRHYHQQILLPYGTWQEHQQRQNANHDLQHEDLQQQKIQQEEQESQQQGESQQDQDQQEQNQQQENHHLKHQCLQSHIGSPATV